MHRELTIGSLFSGIGGLELGLERAGMRTLWQVEIDDYASKVLEKHWPDALRFRDVREVGAHNLPPVDVICGGFPCQDISVAGKGAGIDGERSGLWSEYARIVRELRPRYVVVENVAALLARGLGRVLGDLAACGYDAEWDCIPAAAVGAHHRRDRLFIVAYAHGEQHEGDGPAEWREGAEGFPGSNRVLPHAERNALREQPVCKLGGGGADVSGDNGAAGAHPDADRERLQAGAQLHRQQKAWREIPDRDDADRLHHPLAHPHESRLPERPIFGGDAREELASAFRSSRTGAGIWATEPDVGRVADGVPRRVDRLRCLGNAVVPQVAEFIGRRIVKMEEQHADAA